MTEIAAPKQDESHEGGHHDNIPLWTLVLGSLGVVFGDIGTSPLYSLQECLTPPHGVDPTQGNILGLLSLFFWSLMAVVTLKYVVFLMRADNHGEGGIMALLALVPQNSRAVVAGRIGIVTLMVLAGAALLFGDGVITPAISVLSAIEGLGNADPSWKPYIVRVTVAILVGLFAIQSRGTGLLGNLFGPIMAIWFATLGYLGLVHINTNPAVLSALNPIYAAQFFSEHGFHGFALLGSVVLAVTGGEALYADMGHFGAKSIRISWMGIVLPCLVLNYFGQGAMLLHDPSLRGACFFSMISNPSLKYPMVLLATAATVIASQALISAVFSLTHQAMRLGYFPRVRVLHTSADVEGQIFIPIMNWALAIGCLALVAIFEESSKLAAAYGLAVSGTMTFTSLVFFVVTRESWGWSFTKSFSLLILFLCFDIPFLIATSLKFTHGGYIPFLIGGGVFAIMVLWTKGRSILSARHRENLMSVEQFKERLSELHIQRIAGTGVYLASSPNVAPVLMHLLMKHFRTLPQNLVFLHVHNESKPYVDEASRVKFADVGDGIWVVYVRCGFQEFPNVPAALRYLPEEIQSGVTYFVGRESLMATDAGLMKAWQEKPFAVLLRNSLDVSLHFQLPPDNVVEIGGRMDL